MSVTRPANQVTPPDAAARRSRLGDHFWVRVAGGPGEASWWATPVSSNTILRRETQKELSAALPSLNMSELSTAMVSAIISGLSLVVALLALGVASKSTIAARKPVVVFEYDPQVGWRLRNVGNGPAINVRVAIRGKHTEWTPPTSVPSLPTAAEYNLPWVAKLNAWMLGAQYTDFEGMHYTTVSQHDLNRFERGEVLARFTMPDFDYLPGRKDRRVWDTPDLSNDASLN